MHSSEIGRKKQRVCGPKSRVKTQKQRIGKEDGVWVDRQQEARAARSFAAKGTPIFLYIYPRREEREKGRANNKGSLSRQSNEKREGKAVSNTEKKKFERGRNAAGEF